MSPSGSREALTAAFAALREGHKAEAWRVARELVAAQPELFEAWHLAGLCAAQAGDMARAEEAFRRAANLNPREPTLFFNLGNAVSRQGRHAESAVYLRNALALQPEAAEVWFNLGNALRALRDWQPAAEAFERAAQLRPGYVKARINLAEVQREMGRIDMAEESLRTAVAEAPDNVTALNNLGNLLREIGRPDESAAVLRRAIEVDPGFFRAWNNLGSALRDTGDLAAALAAYDRALELKPDHAEARLNRSMAMLAAGDYENGWAEYEWRWRGARENPGAWPNFKQPQWHGEPPDGRSILLHAEQGFGDALQFVRYAPLVAARGARVILECPGELARLFARLPGVAQVVPKGAVLPAFDLHCPLMSLPLACGTTLATVPNAMPYLVADPAKVQGWRERLGGQAGMRVGIVWAGNPRRHDPVAHLVDRRRSIHLRQLEALLAVPGVRFFSLQKGEAEAQIAEVGANLTSLAADLHDFDDTAAVMAALDLVITVDTSVAHLAGGLARPVWVLSRFDACWRWGQAGEATPWYPTMRILRQKRYGDWSDVLAGLAGELDRVAACFPGVAEVGFSQSRQG